MRTFSAAGQQVGGSGQAEFVFEGALKLGITFFKEGFFHAVFETCLGVFKGCRIDFDYTLVEPQVLRRVGTAPALWVSLFQDVLRPPSQPS